MTIAEIWISRSKYFFELQIKKETKPELVRSVVFHRTLGAMEPEKRDIFTNFNNMADTLVILTH